MGTNFPCFCVVFVTTLIIIGTTSAHHIRIPNLCEAEGEFSEECLAQLNRDKDSNLILNSAAYPPQARFFLYTDSKHPRHSSEIFTGNKASVLNANPHLSVSQPGTWKILIPGYPYNGRSPFPDNVREAYVELMERNSTWPRLNILVVNWDPAGCTPNTQYENGTTYIELVGEQVANMLFFLNDNKFLQLNNDVHVVGFSLGAHLAGETARSIFRRSWKHNMIYRISALDPLNEKYWQPTLVSKTGKKPLRRAPALRRSFVEFLDVYHTNDAEFGMRKHIGDLDVFSANGMEQSPCLNNDNSILGKYAFKDLCSHVYATELFAESIRNRSIRCCTGFDDYDQFKTYTRSNFAKCEDRPIVGDAVAEDTTDSIPSPIGRGFFEFSNSRLRQFGTRFENLLVAASPLDVDRPMCNNFNNDNN